MSESEPADRLRVFVFSGHMIDAPGRPRPRFPPILEPAVDQAIRRALAEAEAGAQDVAIASAACGGDILFGEAMLDRAVPLRVYLPFDEPTFLDKSVRFAGDRWVERYRAVVARAQRFIAPEALGPLAEGADPYERTNLWMLDEARRIGGTDVSFICLWNGEGGDGPGGTQHMMDIVREMNGRVEWIDIRTL
jgi:hypothetical protein